MSHDHLLLRNSIETLKYWILDYVLKLIATAFVLLLNNIAIRSEGARNSLPNKDHSSVLQEERAEPCHLSSSLYYGGQEVYSQSPSTHHASGSYPIVSHDE